MRSTSRKIATAFLLCCLLTGLGIWVLLHPASIFVQPWRAQRSTGADNKVLLGPYPVEEDFIDLRKRGITTVISLLEPRLPYEAQLLAEERVRAARHGMRVLNFPMGSVLGQKFGDAYLRNSRAAAEAALRTDGAVYIHCYLGLHRARQVQDYLAQFTGSQTFNGRNSDAALSDLNAEHAAQAAYQAGDFTASLKLLATIRNKAPRITLLEAWSHYRLRDIPHARTGFEAVLRSQPDNPDALAGVGYSALAMADAERAVAVFGRLLTADPNNVSALEGLAFARNRQGRRDEARSLLQRAVALNPENPETRQLLDNLQPAPPNDNQASPSTN